ELEQLAAFGELLQAHVELETELRLESSGDLHYPAKHRLRAVRFLGLPGQDTLVVPALPAPISASITESSLEVRASAATDGSDAVLVMGDHAFGLPIGQYELVALDLALEARYGHDLRGTLSAL